MHTRMQASSHHVHTPPHLGMRAYRPPLLFTSGTRGLSAERMPCPLQGPSQTRATGCPTSCCPLVARTGGGQLVDFTTLCCLLVDQSPHITPFPPPPLPRPRHTHSHILPFLQPRPLFPVSRLPPPRTHSMQLQNLLRGSWAGSSHERRSMEGYRRASGVGYGH